MTIRMLIDASHEEETRVAIVDGNRVEDFDYESSAKKQLKGSIYLAKVTRVEPSLQAAFVEYGGNRHGFLAFSEIHPDYYQIPVADREALIAQEAAANDDLFNDEIEKDLVELKADANSEEAVETKEEEPPKKNGRRTRKKPSKVVKEDISQSEKIEGDVQSEDNHDLADDGDLNRHLDDMIPNDDTVDAVTEVNFDEEKDEEALRIRMAKRLRYKYKIQEVIKKNQIILIQVVKEERGNKGAALTSYLSLPGRYCVLMPNTLHGGGVSRKIASVTDRKNLKSILSSLDLPKGHACIIRTAGKSRTKAEIKRDYEYLKRMWESIRELTLKSIAPSLIYEEGNLIKRSLRDLYTREVSEILVEGESGYKTARSYMNMLMPSHAKKIKNYEDKVPLFQRYQVETHLDSMFSPTAQLKSGGYIVINPTEALVSIDVNSGRATKEHNIEETAYKTNLEAAEEISRQLKMRDMAGLIVIDFIDMEENRNNRAVERKLKECLKSDRARIQVGHISSFGLLEMSRQRIRVGVLESSTNACPHCEGSGLIRSVESQSLHIIRVVEEEGIRGANSLFTVYLPTTVAIYILNNKRHKLNELEDLYGIDVTITIDNDLTASAHRLEKSGPPSKKKPAAGMRDIPQEEADVNTLIDVTEEDVSPSVPAANDQKKDDYQERQRKRRRRKRNQFNKNDDYNGHKETVAKETASNDVSAKDTSAKDTVGSENDAASDQEKPDRFPRRRRSRRNRQKNYPQNGTEQNNTQNDKAVENASNVVVPAENVAEKTATESNAVLKEDTKPKRNPRKKSVKRTDKEDGVKKEDVKAKDSSDVDSAPAKQEKPKDAKPKPARKPRAPKKDVAKKEDGPIKEKKVEKQQAAHDIKSDAPSKQTTPKADVAIVAEAKPKKKGWWSRS
jgi:ribonuclease E